MKKSPFYNTDPRRLLLALLLSGLSLQASAEKIPRNGTADARIKEVTYNVRDVVTITAHYGYSSMIEFADYEKIQTISLGDTLAWNILDVKNRIFLKPVEDKADTNMQVVTSHRLYNFALKARETKNFRDQALTFTLRFRYPNDEINAARLAREQAAIESAPKAFEVVQNRTFAADDVNMEYTFRGAEDIAPRRTFDDGQFTYFLFNSETATPAIFLSDVNSEEEALVNFHRKGQYVVVERIARKFVLRHGNLVTCIYNERYRPDFSKSTNLATFDTPAEQQRMQYKADPPPVAGTYLPVKEPDQSGVTPPITETPPRSAPVPDSIQWFQYE